MIRSCSIVLVLPLVLTPSCSKKKEDGNAETQPPSAENGEPAAAETPGSAPEKAPPAVAASSFEATLSGAVENTFQGDMAIVYDMAGFGHISLNGTKFSIDFNSKKDLRPQAGTIELAQNNLMGWIGTVEITTDAETANFVSRGGTLKIDAIEDGLYRGSFDFPASERRGKGDKKIEVKGTFTAREKD